MNILITGALGHIGSKLLNNLSKFNGLRKVYIVDSVKSNNINVLFNLNYKNIKIKFIHADLLIGNVLYKIKDRIDVVIHLASITNAEESFKIKNFIYQNNYGIFKNIVKFCIKKKSKLIHLSSTSIYGKQSSFVDETCRELLPQSPYAEIKLMEEKYLNRNKKKLNFITLRLGTIAGISYGMRFHTAVNKFCFKTVLKEKIPVWTNAMNQYRPYLSLNDALKTIVFIINNKKFDNQTYNVLTSNNTVKQILSIIKKLNFKIDIKKTKTPLLNQNSYKVSRKKIEKFNINFSKDIKKDIKETLYLLKNLY